MADKTKSAEFNKRIRARLNPEPRNLMQEIMARARGQAPQQRLLSPIRRQRGR